MVKYDTDNTSLCTLTIRLSQAEVHSLDRLKNYIFVKNRSAGIHRCVDELIKADISDLKERPYLNCLKTTYRINVIFDHTEVKVLKEMALKNGISVNDVVRIAIKFAFDNVWCIDF